MHVFSNSIFYMSALLIVACKPSTSQTVELDLDQITEVVESRVNHSKLAAKILDLADLKEGERVLLMMTPGSFDPMVDELADGIEAVGAYYLGCLSLEGPQPQGWKTRFIEQSAGADADELAEIFKEVDLGIMLPGASPGHMPYQVLQSSLTGGIKRTIHFHWSGAYDLNGKPIEVDDAKALFYQQAVLQTDYATLGARQKAFETAMRNQIVRVTTTAGTDLTFKIGDRPVTKQDGDATSARTRQAKNLIDREIEIPAGAIRVAPLENTVNGTIAFPDGLWDGQMVKGLVVTLENGKIINSTAETGIGHVRREMEQAGDAGRSFREFAVGFNPLLVLQSGDGAWIPYYGYGAGIVRLSLGDNTELGGAVGGGYVRWNFFTDATVTVGDEVWVRDGELIK